MSPRAHQVSGRLCCYDEVPDWRKDNRDLMSGYRQVVAGFRCGCDTDVETRPVSNSFFTSLCSLLYLNNQTVNVYSHIAGAAIFLLSPSHVSREALRSEYVARDPGSYVLELYCYSVAVCFICSAM
jgi:adiponectin receptor